MVMDGPPVRRFDVLVLTPYFVARGQLETVGDALQYINHPERNSLPLYDALLTPVALDSAVKAVQRSHAYIRKPQVSFVSFLTAEGQGAIRTLARREMLAAYTALAVCRGYFHMPAEARLDDFLDMFAGGLVPVSEARVFPLVALPEPIQEEHSLLLMGRSQIQFFHEV
jgi:hypothetical protein